MTNEQIMEQVAKLEKGLNNPNIPDSAKETMKKKISELKSQIIEVEKKEEQIEKKEEKAHEDFAATIAKLEKGLSNPNIPESAKETIKKRIAEAKEKLEAQKKEVKEDKQEAAEEKKEIKEAVEKVAKAVKEEKPVRTPIKKVKVKHKERKAKSEKRKTELKKILTDLEKLVEKNRKLFKYKGKKGDLERDAARPAKPFGYRFAGKHDYRVPTEAQIRRGVKTGSVVYEGRSNRADVSPKGMKRGRIKLEDGGLFGETPAPPEMKKGGKVKHDKAKDAQRFAKPEGWRWKDEAVEAGIISKARLSHEPSEAMRAKYPDYVSFEDRASKSDKKPSRKYQSLKKGGKVKHDKAKDGQRFAKPQGWRWKAEAVDDGIIKKAKLSQKPSPHMRKKYPDYVYKEDRASKSDKKPSRKYISL